MRLLDLHCDTALELYLQNKSLSDSDLHISLKKASMFETYIQAFAIWSDYRLSDSECAERFYKASAYFKNQLKKNSIPLIKSKNDLGHGGTILAVEGARLIDSKVHNIEKLCDAGVRIMTLVWEGLDSIGGAWNTDRGLTPLGIEAVEKCLETGIIPDISHGSEKLSRQVLEIMKHSRKSPLATHSNCLLICNHRRNISAEIFKTICSLGGICGISLCPNHLKGDKAEIDDIIRHIDAFINLGGAKSIALGCDFDGISKTPENIENISRLPRLWDKICRKYGEGACEDIFFNNAYNYLVNNLG